MKLQNFIVRVYGIYIDPERGLLVSDELIEGKNTTKFPGGGMEYGEGTKDCLKREMMEEMNCEFDVDQHFYTTDFFVESAFHPGLQLISIYYRMKLINGPLNISEKAFDFKNEKAAQSFRFIPVKSLREEDFTFVIDKYVVKLLMQNNEVV
jgi:8-oxo-dGTP diphosphatase